MQSSEQSGKIWQWEISWVQIWGNRKSLFYFVLKPKPQTSTLWIVAIWLYRAVKMTRGFILSTAIAVNVAIFHSHALPDHRVNFSYFRTCKSKGVVDARSTLVIWVQNSMVRGPRFQGSVPRSRTWRAPRLLLFSIFCFSSKLRHFLEKSLEDRVASWSWLAGSQIWLILNRLLETRERVIDFCKTGEEGFPSKSLLSKHTLGCLQIKGDFTVRWCLLSNMQITFNSQPTNPSCSNCFNCVVNSWTIKNSPMCLKKL